VDVRLHGCGLPFLQGTSRPLPHQAATTPLRQSLLRGQKLEREPQEDTARGGGVHPRVALLLGDLGRDQRRHLPDTVRVLGVRRLQAETLLRTQEEVHVGHEAASHQSADQEEELQSGVNSSFWLKS
jgi:hypothetical protein